MNQSKLHQLGNTAGLVMVCIILSITFGDQYYQHDLPCPLCLLQRSAFVAVGLCLGMNLFIGIKTIHYGLMILSALLGASTSFRQVLLHVTPGDPGYGHLIFGFNLYMLSSIAFLIILGLIGIAMLFEQGFNKVLGKPGALTFGVMILFLILILSNGISTFVECGFFACEENPVHYDLLSGHNHVQ